MAPDDVTIRLATPADGARCNAFYNAYYSRTRTLRQWEWEFCRRVFDDGTIPFAVAESGGDIVGTQALIPIQLVDPEGSYWSAKSEETLVAASQRGRGLFKRLYAPLLDVARRHELRSIWGFTPASSAFEKEGFTRPTRTTQLLRSFGGQAITSLLASASQPAPARVGATLASAALSLYGTIASAVTSPAVGAGIRVAVLGEPPAWADDMSHRFAAAWDVTTLHRSAEYMRWRFYENPFRRPIVLGAWVNDVPAGWLAFGLGSAGTAAIVDVVALPSAGARDAKSVVAALAEQATSRSRDMGATAIRAWHVTGHPFAAMTRSVLQRQGWVHTKRGFDMVLKHTPGLDPRLHATNIDRWYVSRAFTEGSDV